MYGRPGKHTMIIERTTALCRICNIAHDATIERTGGRIEGVVHCPEGESRCELSTDAEMFLTLRNRSSTPLDRQPAPDDLRYVLNYLSITNACNLNCAVCGADAKTGKETEDAYFLSLGEIMRRARQVKKYGGRILHLFGGEPTLHPELMAIVKRLSGMGFSLGLVTNGVLLGRDEALARKLKHHGLSRICLQFDSLSEPTLRQLGRDHLETKKTAIQNALEAGLSLGLNCTVTESNGPELAELLAHGLQLGAGVKNMTFASAAPVGRYLLSSTASPDREGIIKGLLGAGGRFGFNFNDVLPMPAFRPWGLQVHPECGAHVVLVRSPDGIRALNRSIDLHKVYQRLGRSRLSRNPFTRTLLPALFGILAIRQGKLGDLLRTATGLLFKRPGYGIVNIGISNYRGAMFLDERRISRCASAFYTSVGPVRSCVHFLGNQDVPGSREHEDMNTGCPMAG